MYVVPSKCSRNHFICRNTKQYDHLKYSYFKTVSFCDYTLLPATEKLLKPFLQHVLWKTFQHSYWCQQHHTSAVPSLLLSVKRTGKYQLEPGQESIGDASVLSHGSLLRSPWTKPFAELEHCHEGETFRSDLIQKATKYVNIHFFIRVTIPANNISEFL